MEPIKHLLKNNGPDQPPQVTALKKYALDNYGIEAPVRVSSKYYSISAPNAAVAHKLRIDTLNIIEACGLDKRLVIRISS